MGEGEGGLAGFSTLRGLFSHWQRLVLPALACVSDVVQDGRADHLSVSLAPLSSVKSRSGVGRGEGEMRSGGGGGCGGGEE